MSYILYLNEINNSIKSELKEIFRILIIINILFTFNIIYII